MKEFFRIIFCLFFLLFFLSNLFSKEIKIVRLLDSNLFLTDDGKRISLANIKIPSVQDPDTLRQYLAQAVKEFARNELLKRHFVVEYAAEKDSATNASPVYLFKKFPIGRQSINKLFLEKGFGSYDPNPASAYSKDFFAAGQKAKKAKRGIWDLAKYIPEPPSKQDRRARAFWIGPLDENFSRSFRADIPVTNVNFRSSKIDIRKNDKPLKAGYFWEFGVTYFVLPYFEMGPEIRLFNYWSFEAHVGMVTYPFTITQGYLPRQFYGGTSTGQIVKFTNKFRIEIEEGILWFSSEDHPDHISYVSVGVGLK